MIIYFSGTGNSYSVAKRLGTKIGDTLVPLNKAVNDNSKNIIFVFPTYFFDIPKNVRDFIRTFHIYDYQNIIGISTSGGENGNSEYTFNKLINEKGLHVNKFMNLTMTDNSFSILFNNKVTYVNIDIDKVIEELLTMDYVNTSKYKNIYKASESLLFNKTSKKIFKVKVEDNKCTGCNICSSICPNSNIKVVNSTAKIHGNCAYCFGCIHWCPSQALYITRKIKKENQCPNKSVNYKELNK